MKHSGMTDIGLHRKNNQDSFAVFSGASFLCAIVCDGMGGAKGGNIASGLAVKTFASFVRKALDRAQAGTVTDEYMRSLLCAALERTNKAVYEKSLSDDDLDGMGTTLVAVIVCDSGTYAINVGDSRLYLQKNGLLEQVSVDHSFVQYLIDKGDITPEQAAVHPNKNIILRAVGVNETVTGDVFILGDYDRLLLCTDGLTNHVSPSRIGEIIGAAYEHGKKISLRSKVAKLIEEANGNGGSDNITAVLLEI